jgi:hypothetical protein
MADLCAACGKPITTVRASHHVITLERVWVHYSRRANRSHRAIPTSMLREEPDHA